MTCNNDFYSELARLEGERDQAKEKARIFREFTHRVSASPCQCPSTCLRCEARKMITRIEKDPTTDLTPLQRAVEYERGRSEEWKRLWIRDSQRLTEVEGKNAQLRAELMRVGAQVTDWSVQHATAAKELTRLRPIVEAAQAVEAATGVDSEYSCGRVDGPLMRAVRMVRDALEGTETPDGKA